MKAQPKPASARRQAPAPAPASSPSEKAERLKSRHLIGIEGLDPGEILLILDTAEEFLEIGRRPVKKVPALRNRTVINAFFEPSTRTRTSFEIAEKRLSADLVNFSASTSSVTKGETLVDTIRNLEAMSPDIYVVRHSSPGAPQLIARHVRGSVVNAGDGAHEHPTQALLDAFTMRRHKGRLRGLRVAIIGDVLHSRVARSNVHLLTRMGADCVLCGPPTLMPPGIEGLGVRVTGDVDEAVEGRDVVMALRIQLERQDRTFFPSVREYFNRYGLTPERVRRAAPDAIVMHPGPMNRNVEIDPAVADGPSSVILDQVTNGVAVRMAVLYLIAGSAGGTEEDLR